MTLDVSINLRASVCYSLSRMIREHSGINQPTLISESCVVCSIIHSKQITAVCPGVNKDMYANIYLNI